MRIILGLGLDMVVRAACGLVDAGRPPMPEVALEIEAG
jgi:hypothetical protein